VRPQLSSVNEAKEDSMKARTRLIKAQPPSEVIPRFQKSRSGWDAYWRQAESRFGYSTNAPP
jgi:hypothetical protein